MDLTGKLLVAMPGMGDPRFERSVVYLSAYSDQGAMGLIVNKPASHLKLSDVLEQLTETSGDGREDLRVYMGGPVETGRGFVLHSPDYRSAIDTLRVADDFAVTATIDILEDLAAGKGPKTAQLMLGYSGWGPGQLEGEITQNGWLTCDATPELVFDFPDADKWEAALKSIGVDPLGLSAAHGHA